ncbi:MAG: BrnA antitoxin family protein [Leptolyngbyaceae cyanobacterium SU_3_3]|nr:BrnA antitoxin family protein [Leptolyngbyaceae cyanobacterium SU_3_3]
MNNSFSSKTSQTDWDRIEAMTDEDIDLSDIPEVTEAQMSRAVLRVGGKSVERSQRRVELLLDAFIVEYFEAKAGEQGCQALMNQALAEYIRQH